MRIRCFAAACAAALLLVGLQAASATLLIKIDKSAQQMTVTDNGKLVYTWPVSTGRRGYNTPSGDFKVLSMDRHHRSREWDNAPMPYSMFFTDQGHAIHGTNEVRHLGRAASHGCVRLSVAHAAKLWKLVEDEGKANTQVELTGKIPSRRAVASARAKHRHELAAKRHRLREARKRRALRAARHRRELRKLREARRLRRARTLRAAARHRRYVRRHRHEAHARAARPAHYAARRPAPRPRLYADRAGGPPPPVYANGPRPYPYAALGPAGQ